MQTTKEIIIKWVTGNKKLNKLKTIGFGIPARESKDGTVTCPMWGTCGMICYARQGSYKWPATVNAREHNLAVILKDLPAFTKQAIADLSRSRKQSVRIHDSGDFISQAYLDSWIAIALATPSKTFYAYTKSLHLDYSKLPVNFHVIQSQGGRMDAHINKKRPHAIIFKSHEARIKAGYIDGSETDLPAIQGKIKIGLVYHGQKNPTIEQFNKLAGVS